MKEPTKQLDFYKTGHQNQYPKGTNLIMDNWTGRKSRITGLTKYVYFGTQYWLKEYLMKEWNELFFKQPKEDVINSYLRTMNNALGKNVVTVKHLEALHDLGYMPIEIMSLPEGVLVPMRVPSTLIFSTHDDFYWLPNYLESIFSCTVWGGCTSATTADRYKRILNKYADLTVGNRSFVQWQAHDFSMRGMFGLEAACISGAAHLLSFTGTDTVPAIGFLEEYYNADSDKELVGGSVPATEHSVMCMGTKDNEIGTFESLITKSYPSGIISIVSDTWDFWKVITEYLPQLKEKIIARDGKVVIRPDSGDPVKIICGDPMAEHGSPEYKGAIECMWETFGGTTTEKGYKYLDSHIGLIYGDSITVERCEEICQRLMDKGFCSFNVVFGVGSYTYAYVTRDTLGFAVKATYGEVNGEPREIFKEPKTDDGTKNSAKGLLAVYKNEGDGEYYLKDQVSWNEVRNCEFKTIFKDGELIKDFTLAEIRATIAGNK